MRWWKTYKKEETWKVRKWVEELCYIEQANSIAERWKFSAIDASDAEADVDEEDASPFESVSAIFKIVKF